MCLSAKNRHSRLSSMAVVRKLERGAHAFASMEPALANTAPSLSMALKMHSCIACTDLRPVSICASVAHREGSSHDDLCSSKLLPRTPGHMTSSQLIAYACHNQDIMISCKHGTFWRGLQSRLDRRPSGTWDGNAYILDRWRRLPGGLQQILAAHTHPT